MEKFRTNLKELRVRHNLTQEDLAEDVGWLVRPLRTWSVVITCLLWACSENSLAFQASH